MHCRPSWIISSGVKYQPQDYVIIGWQDDDLPLFGHISSIFVAQNIAFLKINTALTLGVDHHYHSLLIQKGNREEMVVSLSELKDIRVYNAHLLSNGCLYITLRSHVENVCATWVFFVFLLHNMLLNQCWLILIQFNIITIRAMCDESW